jgi:alpha-1,2-mannosyltransferase
MKKETPEPSKIGENLSSGQKSTTPNTSRPSTSGESNVTGNKPKPKFFLANLVQLSSFHIYFAVFIVYNMMGVFINHIDDTDETYGYWEPLHYLLYGKGMQTWEYSPDYALRSYAFIFPVYLLSLQCKMFGFNKIQTFYAIRILFGVFTAYAEASFVKVLETTLSSPSVARITLIFLLTSPGVLFASTAYLPSAVAMSFLMLSYANWLGNEYNFAIFWGSVAVLWTGWPFVGLLFAPIGIHMIWCESKQKRTSRLPPSFFITKLFISGFMIVAIVLIPSMSIDYHYYRKL